MSHAFEIAVARAANLPSALVRPRQRAPDDTWDMEGAQRLADVIREYWAERGFVVKIRLDEVGFSQQTRCARVDIRSDMRNGFPTRRAP